MKKNMGKTDRIIRTAAGLFLLSMVFWADGGLKYVGLAGIIPLATASVSFCPMYAALGIDSISKEEKKTA